MVVVELLVILLNYYCYCPIQFPQIVFSWPVPWPVTDWGEGYKILLPCLRPGQSEEPRDSGAGLLYLQIYLQVEAPDVTFSPSLS